MVVGGVCRRHRCRPRGHLVDRDPHTEKDTAIDGCLCPCHIDGLIDDADLKARLEAECKCQAITEALRDAESECARGPDCWCLTPEAIAGDHAEADTDTLCPCSRPGYDHREPCPGHQPD